MLALSQMKFITAEGSLRTRCSFRSHSESIHLMFSNARRCWKVCIPSLNDSKSCLLANGLLMSNSCLTRILLLASGSLYLFVSVFTARVL